MQPSPCVQCKRPVLELQGQFEKLDSYYLSSKSPLLTTAGWWHTLCLLESDVGPAWQAARLDNFQRVRGYTTLAELPQWTIAKHRDVLAFGKRGQLLELVGSTVRHVSGGAVAPHVDRTYHLELADVSLVDAIRRGLSASGTYPVVSVLEGLGVLDRTFHREALDGGVFRFDADLEEFWTASSVSALVEYGVFLPSELEPFLVG